MSTYEYDVFLSFRGEDTRSSSFTDHLYEQLRLAGTRVFRDDDEFNICGTIAEEYLRAIADSSIYVVVFCKNYASSKWCLSELSKIVESKGQVEGKQILPIFYGVTSDDVKLKTHLYSNQLLALSTTEEDQTVQLWKNALLSIPHSSEWEHFLTNLKSDEEYCREIVRRVLVMLKLKQVRTSECLVGMDEQVENMMELLDVACPDVQVIVICGISGIGKTTMASVVFDKICGSFDHCSFLRGIQDYAVDTRLGGPLELQRKLLTDVGYGYMQVRDSFDAMSTIQNKFSGRRVLIVLDDIRDVDEIKEVLGDFGSFGEGSRIIVTTRNTQNLQISGLMSKICLIEEMKRENALQLFSLHAFGRPNPLPEFSQFSERVVLELTGGLPLAIEVIGSLLYGKSKEKWQLTIESLGMIGKEKVKEKLKLSYENLCDETKEIFLDIACLFVGEEITEAMYMWGGCNFYPELGFEELTAMSLVKMRRNKFWMHEQVRDLGRETVRQEGLKEERSRLWTSHDAGMLKRGKKIKLERYFDDCGRMSIGSLKALEKLSLSGMRISRLPESIGELVKLKRLSMKNCCEIKSLPDSIGRLVKLEELELGGCSKLISTPSSLTSLIKLRWLDLSDCLALKSLPDCTGKMGLLKEIDVSGSGIRKLPRFIKMQKQLEVIKAEGSGLDGVPLEVEMLSCLRVLKLTGTRICGLPSLSQLTCLEELDLDSCDYIEELPMLPASLTSLRVASESLQSIADLSHLTKLKSLLISSTKKDDRAAGAQSPYRKPRDELPWFNIEWIGGLLELTNLCLTISKITTIPAKFCALSQLKQLTLQYSYLPCSLPLPYNLSTLNLSHLKGSKSLYLSLLKNLKAFSLSSCEDLTEIPGLGELESLQSLYIYNCTSLERLDDISKLRKLKSLELSSCSNVRDIQGLWGLESLVKLNIDMCNSLERLAAAPLLPPNTAGESKTTARLNSLVLLDVFISRCDMLKDVRGVEELVSSRSFIIKDCTSLERLFDLSRLRYLTEMTLQKCMNLREIQGLEELESVKQLVIQDCSCLERLPELSNLRLLERLHVEKCRKLREIDGLESVFLKFLHISYCKSLERLGIDPREMNRLEYLCIEFCQNLREIHNASSGILQRLKNSSLQVDHGCHTTITPKEDGSSNSTTTFATPSSDPVVASCSSSCSSEEDQKWKNPSPDTTEDNDGMQTCLISDSKAAAKAVLKCFFSGGIEMLAQGSADLVPVMEAAKALSLVVEDQTDGDSLMEFSSKLEGAYRGILDSIKAAEVSHANYAKLKECAVEMRDKYNSVKSQMDHLQATKEKALSEIDTLQARIMETDQKLQIAASERQLLVTAMKEQVDFMKAAQEEIQARDAQRHASVQQLISLKTQWDSWAARLLHPDH